MSEKQKEKRAFKNSQVADEIRRRAKSKKPIMTTAMSDAVTKKKPVKEEAEPLDELSKKTLGSYINKSAMSAAAEVQKNGISNKSIRRFKGIKKATDKLTKEEVEPLEELSKKTLVGYQVASASNAADHGVMGGKTKSNPKARHHRDQIEKRITGIYKAGVRLADKKYGKAKPKLKEEAEPLDELSKKTLGSYIKKAADNVDDASSESASSKSYDYPNGDEAASKKVKKRLKGIGKATDKLTKEESDMSDISLVESAQAQNAVDFRTVMFERMEDKVQEVLESAKRELASTMFLEQDEEDLEEARIPGTVKPGRNTDNTYNDLAVRRGPSGTLSSKRDKNYEKTEQGKLKTKLKKKYNREEVESLENERHS